MKISKHKLFLAPGLLLSGAIQIAGYNADMPGVLQYVLKLTAIVLISCGLVNIKKVIRGGYHNGQ